MNATIEQQQIHTQAWEAIFQQQKANSRNHPPSTYAERLAHLKKLEQALVHMRGEIEEALYLDFRKPHTETALTEIVAIQQEIKHIIKHLKGWMRPKRVGTPLPLLGTSSQVYLEPKGTVLILSPWNYPFSLAIGPLAQALAAGNTAIVKPSEMTPHTSAAISKLVKENFPPTLVTVVEGDAQVAGELLKMPFDHIFFTGSPAVGKIVMRAAAENLTSVTLELGGKSPAIVYDRADVADAARKIAWGKLVNNGQTCIAPDYLFVDEKIAADFIKAFQEAVTSYYNPEGKGIAASDSYARIINTRHFNRLQGLVQDALDSGAQVLMGGTHDPEQRFFHPTLLGNVAHGARIMEEEIFGPILPLFTFKDPKEAYETIAGKPKPLALYLFTKDRQQAEAGLAFTTAGGTCINDTLIHFTNPDLPFGGVNNSGIGKSHGYYSFQAFSNERAVIRQRTGLTTLSPIYPPYNGKVKKMVDLMLKWL